MPSFDEKVNSVMKFSKKAPRNSWEFSCIYKKIYYNNIVA